MFTDKGIFKYFRKAGTAYQIVANLLKRTCEGHLAIESSTS